MVATVLEYQYAVVMMAGGLGTRLSAYTNILPKPLIPIGEEEWFDMGRFDELEKMKAKLVH